MLLILVRLTHPDPPAEQPITTDQLKAAGHRLGFDEVNRQIPLFADYLTATLHPGLTPAQRRTVLTLARADLSLPLPPGIRRPVFSLDPP